MAPGTIAAVGDVLVTAICGWSGMSVVEEHSGPSPAEPKQFVPEY